MFELGWTEIVVIAIVLIIVVGPKDLPGMLRSFGRTMSKLRSMAGEFRSQFDEALKEAELDDVRKTLSEARKLNPARELRDAMNPLKQAGEGLKADLDRTMREKPKGSEAVAKPDPGASETTASSGTAATGAAKPAATPAAANPATAPAEKVAAAPPVGTGAGAKKPAATPRKPAAAKPAARKTGAGGTAVKAAPKKNAAVKKTPPKKKAGDA